jgi:hypothetical protein
MESKTTRRFRDAFNALPAGIQDRARRAHALFYENPGHPSLRFKKVHMELPVYAARITRDYRAVGVLHENLIASFWIGSHSDYEKLLDSL